MVVCLVFSEMLLIYFAVALIDQHQDAKLDLTIQRFSLTLLLSVFSTITSQCSTLHSRGVGCSTGNEAGILHKPESLLPVFVLQSK